MVEISNTDCSKLRSQYQEGIVVDQLASEFGVSETTVKYHLRGDCKHDNEVPSIEWERTNVSPSECESIRNAFDEGESPHEIADKQGRNWHTIYEHLTGKCSHEGESVFASEEILEWQPVPVGRCEEMRQRAREGEAVTEIAADSTWDYQTILKHVNGACGHTSTTVAPREKEERADDLGESDCRELRSAYAATNDTIIEYLISEHDISEATATRHIRYGCAHRAQGEIKERIQNAGLEKWMGGQKASTNEESADPPSTDSRSPAAGSEGSESERSTPVDNTDSTSHSNSSHNEKSPVADEESVANAAVVGEDDSCTPSERQDTLEPVSAGGQTGTDYDEPTRSDKEEEENESAKTTGSANTSASPIDGERGEDSATMEKGEDPTWTVSLGVVELAALRAIDPDTDVREQALKAATTSAQNSLDDETPPIQNIGETVECTLYPTDRLAMFVNTLIESNSTPYTTKGEFINAAISDCVSEHAPRTEVTITIDGTMALALSNQGNEDDQHQYIIESLQDHLRKEL